ncbi:13792_t:CDS:2, partial [Gigaspora margarita]
MTFCPGRILAKRDDAICIATKDGEISKNIRNIPEINNKQILTTPMTNNFQEINIELFGSYGILQFDFYNGAMSTSQCERLLKAIKQCQKMPIKGLILAGNSNNWSNVAAVQDAGAGGVYLALATDFSFVKLGVVLILTTRIWDNANPILAIEAIEIGLFDNIEQQ